MIGAAPICIKCKHFHEGEMGLPCDAYPSGIPDEIIMGGVDHRAPYEGDHGIQFEPLEAEGASTEGAE